MSETKFLAEDAKQVLNNKAFKTAMQRISDHMEAKALSCNPEDRDAAQRVVVGKQIVRGITRELERLIADGEAEIQLKELNPQRKPIFQR